MANQQTIIKGLSATVKFFHKDNGYGYFCASGLPDICVLRSELTTNGFFPIDMIGGVEALIDIDMKTGKPVLVAIDQIGEMRSRKLGLEHAPESEFAKLPVVNIPETKSLVREYRVGDIVVGYLYRGFEGNMSEYGFFTPLNGGANIFVYYRQINQQVLTQILNNRDLRVEIMIDNIGVKGPVGRINNIHIPVNPKVMLPVTQASVVTKKPKDLDAKMARRNNLLNRKTITVVTADGSTNYGIPVMVTEWESIPAGKTVVLVEHFDEATGHVSGLLETFVVEKKGGKPRKSFIKLGLTFPVKETELVKMTPTKIKSIGVGFFKTDSGSLVSAPIFEPKSSHDISQLVDLIKTSPTGRIAIKEGGKYHLGTVNNTGRLQKLKASLTNWIDVMA